MAAESAAAESAAAESAESATAESAESAESVAADSVAADSVAAEQAAQLTAAPTAPASETLPAPEERGFVMAEGKNSGKSRIGAAKSTSTPPRMVGGPILTAPADVMCTFLSTVRDFGRYQRRTLKWRSARSSNRSIMPAALTWSISRASVSTAVAPPRLDAWDGLALGTVKQSILRRSSY